MHLPTPLQTDNQATLDLLQNFNGLPSLKKLQAHLNMDREDAPISRRDWKEATRALLAVDPVITASVGGSARELFSEEQSFKVIYCRLASPELLLTHERAVVTELLGQYPYALFVFSDQAQKRFHFLNVKDEPQGQKRRLFRRITVGDGERLRTAAEQLAKLDGEVLKHLPLSGIHARFDEAFDVGPVTKRFFAEYKRIFELVKAGIQGFAAGQDGEEARNLFTQRLFNRLMFLAFIQKKGWLKYGGNADYLCTLWTAHQRDTFTNKGSFYEGRLKPLFFLGLNTGPSEVNLVGINRGGGLKELIGDVPYLNGGLFEKDADDDDPKIKVPDAGLDAVINNLFEKFNFTITESTPLDIEVAVDPEMLGKIFEELVTGRHESGSYYTPKPIVSFMCREALKGYLETQAANEPKEAIARFVDRHEPEDIRDAEGVLNALRRVTVCDPACGSGAYLLGMLHELLDLRECLFKTKKLDHEKVYDRKLEIIQTNIYGVDIAEFAVNIARLRLWLSLAVDFGGNKPEPLPNLDYKIEVGDSVCSPSPGALQMGMQQALVDDLLRLKADYLRSHHGNKLALRERIETIRNDIRVFSHRGAADFDWVVDFAEVFATGGFNVVIANPPYVRMELFKDIKPILRKNFPAVHAERADLYCYFYARSVELLSNGGSISFISSNKWLRAAYGEGLRRYLSTTVNPRVLVDFGDLPVFATATAYPLIFAGIKTQQRTTFTFADVNTLNPPYPDVAELVRTGGAILGPEAIDGKVWRLQSRASSTPNGPSLGDSGLSVYRGIVTGLNAAFYISDATRAALIKSDPNSAEVILPILMGSNIRRWALSGHGWVIFTRPGIDLSRYRAVKRYLEEHKGALSLRAGKQEWYEIQQPQLKFEDAFRNAKIVFPDICSEPRFALDTRGHWLDATASALPVNDLYLLALLNSSPTQQFFEGLGARIRGGYLRFKTQYVQQIPVPIPSLADRKALSSLAKQCIEMEGVGCIQQETEIDDRVASLLRNS